MQKTSEAHLPDRKSRALSFLRCAVGCSGLGRGAGLSVGGLPARTLGGALRP